MTEREKDTLKFIIDFKKTNGFSPTIKEIAKGINTSSTPHVRNMIAHLVDEGYITVKEHKQRTIVVKKFI